MNKYEYKIPLMNVLRQYNIHRENINKEIQSVLDSGMFIMSSKVKSLESKLETYHGIRNAITVGNGTDALVLSLTALGIRNGDEILVPAMSFFATSEAVVQVGAIPVFVDINEDDFTIDIEELKKKVTPKTKAVLPVHLYGKVANMSEIVSFSKANDLFVIEDNCQSIGASIKEKKAGTYGDVSCTSFFPTKNLGCYGDGGLILTDSDELAERIRALRVHGSGINGVKSAEFFNDFENSNSDEYALKYFETKYNNSIIGFNSRLDEIQAAILNYKLDFLDSWNNRRIEIATQYNLRISNPNVTKCQFYDDGSHVYYVFPIVVENRDDFIEYMNEYNVSTGVYFPIPLHLQAAHANLGYSWGDLPISEKLSKYSVTIPMFPELMDEEVDYIIDVINAYEVKRDE